MVEYTLFYHNVQAGVDLLSYQGYRCQGVCLFAHVYDPVMMAIAEGHLSRYCEPFVSSLLTPPSPLHLDTEQRWCENLPLFIFLSAVSIYDTLT